VDADGAYPAGSVNARIVARLASFARKARARAARERGPEEPGDKPRRRR
jgi:hypothetical protein